MKKEDMSLAKLQDRWPDEVQQFLEREMQKAEAARQGNENVIKFLKRISK